MDEQRKTRGAVVGLSFLGVLAVFWFGYGWIADYGDGVAAGTYVATIEGRTSTLFLRPDHTFHQITVSQGTSAQADGTWLRTGEGGLVFSGSILALPNQRLMPNGDAYAMLNKTAGIWPPFISLDSTTTAPIYRKRFLGRSR